MHTSTSLPFFTAIFVALGGALAEELMICCRHVRTELDIYPAHGEQNILQTAHQSSKTTAHRHLSAWENVPLSGWLVRARTELLFGLFLFRLVMARFNVMGLFSVQLLFFLRMYFLWRFSDRFYRWNFFPGDKKVWVLSSIADHHWVCSLTTCMHTRTSSPWYNARQ